MTRRTQCVVLTLLATLGIRLVLSDVYLRYVHSWMRLPVLATSVLLLLVALRLALTRPDPAHPHDDQVTASTWLLVLPVVAVFTISPPALGAYAAERSTTPVADDSGYTALPDRAVTAMSVGEFTGRAQWGATLRDHPVALTGFVSKRGDAWYLTRLAISCCAADAVAYKVRVTGLAAPARDRWVRVVGTWRDPGRTRLPRIGAPALAGASLAAFPEPADPYE